jgi:DNA helicase-2/ATP-dependent DNA helicase PcrA
VRAFPTEIAEGRGIAAGLLQAFADGTPWRSLAVLTRTNAQLVPIQNALVAAGIPFWAPSQAAVLDDPAARQVLVDLRRDGSRPLGSVTADLREMAGSDPTTDDAGRAALTVLAELAASFAAKAPNCSVRDWLAWLPAAAHDRSGGDGTRDTVTLCSFHRAKGLEWDAVWVAGLERGLVPISWASPGADEDEERRLLYVALTRAATHLHCSWSRQRTFGNRSVGREPSPWLSLIAGADAGVVGPGGAEQWRQRLAEQGAALRDAAHAGRRRTGRARPDAWPDPDAGLVSALRAWRLEAARATGVPAYVILHDATLEAVASLRPRTVEELLAVPGLGPVKTSRYGPTLLTLVAERAESA